MKEHMMAYFGGDLEKVKEKVNDPNREVFME
jgi:hypothetical protein